MNRSDFFGKICFGLTLLLGAFLMFSLQPLVGKLVTPKYGGVAQVWCLCLLFFQTVLLGGYTLSYIMVRLPNRIQGGLYICLFILSLLLLDIPMGDAWIPVDPNHPVYSLTPQLIRYLALPCILLSTVSVLLQNWYGLSDWGDPYHLYSISNVGSLGALTAYPILIEPHFSLSITLGLWTWGYGLLAVLACASAVILIRKSRRTANERSETDLSGQASPGMHDYWLWIFLSAAGSILLISFTNHLTQDIAPVPLLWVLPLCIYLLSFVLCFSHVDFYSQRLFVYPGLILLVLCFCFDILRVFERLSLLISLVLLFFLCMVCHGQLYRARPVPRFLAVYYLIIALGGALGGIAVNFIAPLLFNGYTERYLIMAIMMFFMGYLTLHDNLRFFYNRNLDRVFLFFILLLPCVLFIDHLRKMDTVIYRERNFYGTVKIVKKKIPNQTPIMLLCNGRIVHGGQLMDGLGQTLPTTYFGPDSAVGIAEVLSRQQNSDNPLKIGVIGLGVGTMAHYGRAGDAMTFYEVDPKVIGIAQKQFQYLNNTPASTRILLGDARTTLQRQERQDYDLLIVDAFNGDAIPVHLLTIEALRLYLHHLDEQGLLILHVSNKYLRLSALSANQGLQLGLNGMVLKTKPESPYLLRSEYVVLSRRNWFFKQLGTARFQKDYPTVTLAELKRTSTIDLWTDDYSNLWSMLRFSKKKKNDLLVSGQ